MLRSPDSQAAFRSCPGVCTHLWDVIVCVIWDVITHAGKVRCQGTCALWDVIASLWDVIASCTRALASHQEHS